MVTRYGKRYIQTGNTVSYTVLAATDSNDNFKTVTVSQKLFGKLAAWHDFAVSLNGDALAF